MKLGKDELQKLVLGGLLLIGVVYSYFDLLLFPLLARQEAATKSTVALGPEIDNAQAQIKKTQDLEKRAPELTLVLTQVNAMIPEGSPVAWFPTRTADFFKRQGIEKVTTRLNSETVEKELPGFRRLAWGVDLPKVDFADFGSALCILENEELLLEVNSIQIDASRDDPQTQHALLTVRNFVKQ
ncbi:MAG: hypothetical protein QOE70_1906 [Chthoniobacter sp.]|jgi:hypothetical protein|nr:hypothetical protein [Chthoniobacter sp.]